MERMFLVKAIVMYSMKVISFMYDLIDMIMISLLCFTIFVIRMYLKERMSFRSHIAMNTKLDSF